MFQLLLELCLGQDHCLSFLGQIVFFSNILKVQVYIFQVIFFTPNDSQNLRVRLDRARVTLDISKQLK